MPIQYASGRPNVLVTGGAGFIGSHLCDALVKDNNVICVDNFITGDENNIELLLQNPHFEFIRHDLVKPLSFADFPELKKFQIHVQGVQEIYHLACPTSPKEFDKFPVETLLANSHATYHALQLAVANKAKFLFTSTASVYGELPSDVETVAESYFGSVNPIGPRSAYNEGKRFAESMVSTFGHTSRLDVKIARVFRTYGPRMRIDDGRLTPDWIRSAFEDKPLVIHGDPQIKITFCYVTDIVDGLLRLMRSAIVGPVNIGSSDPHTYQEIAEMIIAITGSNSTITTEPALPHQQMEGVPDTNIARHELGWLPMMNLESGLEETIKHMQLYAHFYGIDKARIGQGL